MGDVPIKILGISAYYHDSAAALVVDGKIVAAAQEERFSRVRHDSAFPSEAIGYCLEKEDCDLNDIDYIVYYDKPFLKFERLIETLIFYSPRSLGGFIKSVPVWVKEKLFLKQMIRKALRRHYKGKGDIPPLLFSSHHQAHAASAFYPGPFESSAILCMDGVGEWATTSAWLGKSNVIEPIWQIDFPHSLGLLYSAFTSFTGFRVNSGEYKLMGLAPYGEPVYEKCILDELIDVKPDGSYRLNMDYFAYGYSSRMVNDKFISLFGGPAREPESELTKREMDIAASIQKVIEDVVVKLSNHLQKETGEKKLSLAGGVALNCVANSKILARTDFDEIWIQPAAGDAGGAVGAALAAWYQYLDQPRQRESDDAMQGAYLGPAFDTDKARIELDALGAVYELMDEDSLLEKTAALLSGKNIVGWFQGRMEFGPRALGGRSILADPRDSDMQSKLNLKIKYRESFRPFAPAVLASQRDDYFTRGQQSPYMLLVADIHESLRKTVENSAEQGLKKLGQLRSSLPAVTHVDYSARVQTVDGKYNPRFFRLLEQFEKLTGCPVLVNTSFNVRGEPIVCRPADAYCCFMNTEMDYLVVENLFLRKEDQVAISDKASNETRGFLRVKAVSFSDEAEQKKQLRQFGVSLALLIALIFGVILPLLGQKAFMIWFWVAAIILFLASWIVPVTVIPVRVFWLGLGKALGRLVTPVILTVMYTVLIAPLGLLLKKSLKDGAFAGIDLDKSSYKVASDPIEPDSMKNPF